MNHLKQMHNDYFMHRDHVENDHECMNIRTCPISAAATSLAFSVGVTNQIQKSQGKARIISKFVIYINLLRKMTTIDASQAGILLRIQFGITDIPDPFF
jgi:hypothetical protein